MLRESLATAHFPQRNARENTYLDVVVVVNSWKVQQGVKEKAKATKAVIDAIESQKLQERVKTKAKSKSIAEVKEKV